MYADDTQLYISLDSGRRDSELSKLQLCRNDVMTWCSSNGLMFNSGKTGNIHLSSRHRDYELIKEIWTGGASISPSPAARDLSVTVNSKAVYKALYNLPLRNLRSTPVIALLQILRFSLRLSNVLLPHKPVTILPIMTCYPIRYSWTNMWTISASQPPLHLRTFVQFVDFGLNRTMRQCIQITLLLLLLLLHPNSTTVTLFFTDFLNHNWIITTHTCKNAAVRQVTRSKKHDHITLVLRNLHWFPIGKRTSFKTLLMTFKALNGQSPVYIS